MQKNFRLYLYLFFALKARLQVFKFEFFQKVMVELRINVQLTG